MTPRLCPTPHNDHAKLQGAAISPPEELPDPSFSVSSSLPHLLRQVPTEVPKTNAVWLQETIFSSKNIGGALFLQIPLTDWKTNGFSYLPLHSISTDMFWFG